MSGENLIVWFKNTGHRYTTNQDGNIEQIGDVTEEEAVKYKLMNTENRTILTTKGVKQSGDNWFIDNEGKVYTWVNNSYGQLGDGTTQEINTPMYLNNSLKEQYNIFYVNSVYFNFKEDNKTYNTYGYIILTTYEGENIYLLYVAPPD